MEPQLSMENDNMDEELERVRKLANDDSNVTETNVLNDGTVSLAQERLEKLDYGIAGIHKQCYRDEGREKNTDNVISCMKNSKIFMISHPDDDHMPLDYERLVPASGKYHAAL